MHQQFCANSLKAQELHQEMHVAMQKVANDFLLDLQEKHLQFMILNKSSEGLHSDEDVKRNLHDSLLDFEKQMHHKLAAKN